MEEKDEEEKKVEEKKVGEVEAGRRKFWRGIWKKRRRMKWAG